MSVENLIERLRAHEYWRVADAMQFIPKAADLLESQAAQIAALADHLRFVERWANHHANSDDGKKHVTPAEALSTIQHYPPIKEITRSYVDGKVPNTRDPWSEIAALTAERDALQGWRDAIDEALVVAHLGVATEPYDDLNRLLEWHHDVWLDPAVSSDAQALIDRGAAEERQRTAQPAQAEFHNPWRTSLENCISGDNYLRASEYCDLIEELDELYRLRAAQPPREPVQPLSNEDIDATWNEREPNLEPRYKVRWFARAIERLITERMSTPTTKEQGS